MRRFFTKHLFLMVLSFVAVDMMGQAINSVIITEPSSIAGAYGAVRQAWGSQSNTPIIGDAAFVNDGSTEGSGTIYDGCQTNNDLSGKIAFVDRGVCAFTIKVKNAQLKGAIAVVICNNNPTEDPFAGAGTDATITIPSVMISYNDCQKIRVAVIAGDAKATLGYSCISGTVDFPESVVWGDKPKEGNFDGGLNDWIYTSDNTWAWAEGGLISGGAYGGSQQSASTTACNGIAAFNSDYLDNGGVSGGDGTGPCPADCVGGLISPNVDLTGKGAIKGIVVQFTQNLLEFSSSYAIVASKDGGISWPDTFQINLEYSTFNRTTAEQVRVGLCGYEGVSQVRIQFLYRGNYYYWGIDDVMILNEYVADTRVNRNFYAAAPSLKTPVSQISEMPFVADISNFGNADAKNTKLEVILTDNAGTTEIGRVTNNYGNVASCSDRENKVFPETFTPPATVGLFRGSYNVSSDDEVINADNSTPFYFLNTESTFGTILSEAEWGAAYMRDVFNGFVEGISGNKFYSVGNAYYVPKGSKFKATKVRFGLANTLADVDNSFLYIRLYEWNDINNDNRCQPEERKTVGGQTVVIENGLNLRNIEVELYGVDIDGSPEEGTVVKLKDNTQYLLMAHTDNDGRTKQQLLGWTPRFFNRDQQSAQYSAVNLAYDSLNLNRSSGTFFNWNSGLEGGDFETRDFYKQVAVGSFNLSGTSVYLEMDIEDASSTYDIAKSGTANVFPNPASRELYIDVTLDNVSANLRVDLVTIEGKVATSKSFSNVQDSRLKLDLSGLNSGTYTAMIHTDSGVIARKVVVQK